MAAQVWLAQVGRVPLLLLDSYVEQNEPGLREVTGRPSAAGGLLHQRGPRQIPRPGADPRVTLHPAECALRASRFKVSLGVHNRPGSGRAKSSSSSPPEWHSPVRDSINDREALHKYSLADILI
jgi:hypothetical protein